MSKNNKSDINNLFEKRVRMFLEDFSAEAYQVRERIVRTLPAFHVLLSLDALSFEELALQLSANERGIKYDKKNPPKPTCPYCNDFQKVNIKTKGVYRCTACNKTFTANHKSISSGTKCEALVWMQVFQCLLNAVSISKTCEYCNIAPNTYYNIRNRLFYAMELLLEDVKLYGTIEVDNTFIRASYKGMMLKESEFDEDSIFFDPTYIARPARKRGRANSIYDRNTNSICIFTAIDDRGHVLTRFAGVGATNHRVLKQYISDNKYLRCVPDKDPFKECLKEQTQEPNSKTGDISLFVSDKEAAIEKYAHVLGFPIESHVYRIDGVQIKLPKGSHNIQRVNALHRRLKLFLQQHNYVSSKYLPGYLTLFEFIENTGASQAAINKVFSILARPNFDKSSDFFEQKYMIPNYLEEWLIDGNALKKLPYKKLLTYILYDQLKNREQYPEHSLTMTQIQEETGYTAPTIRNIYSGFTDAGYREKILKFFKKEFPTKSVPKPKKSLSTSAPATINPTVLAIYDEYAAMRSLPIEEQIPLKLFIAEKNKQNNTNYSRTNILNKFAYIEKHGIRPPLPSFNGQYPKNSKDGWYKGDLYKQEYDRIVREYRSRGEKPPKREEILEMVGEKYGLTPNTVKTAMYKQRKKSE